MIYEEIHWIEVVLSLLTFFDWYCHLYILCLLRQIFLAADSKVLRNSSRRHSVLIDFKFVLITGNTSLEPLLEGLLTKIYVDWSARGSGRIEPGTCR